MIFTGNFEKLCSKLHRHESFKSRHISHKIQAFDTDKDGLLSCGELWGGLEWLGLNLSPDDIYAVVRYVGIKVQRSGFRLTGSTSDRISVFGFNPNI